MMGDEIIKQDPNWKVSRSPGWCAVHPGCSDGEKVSRRYKGIVQRGGRKEGALYGGLRGRKCSPHLQCGLPPH